MRPQREQLIVRLGYANVLLEHERGLSFENFKRSKFSSRVRGSYTSVMRFQARGSVTVFIQADFTSEKAIQKCEICDGEGSADESPNQSNAGIAINNPASRTRLKIIERLWANGPLADIQNMGGALVTGSFVMAALGVIARWPNNTSRATCSAR